MTEQIKATLRDYAWARWTALVLVALMMFFAYMFVDVMSPLQSLVETELGWTPGAFGYYAGAEYILNVFGFLILAGIILDKMGVRFTGTLSASLMLVGACIKLYAISSYFAGTALEQWLSSPLTGPDPKGTPNTARRRCCRLRCRSSRSKPKRT